MDHHQQLRDQVLALFQASSYESSAYLCSKLVSLQTDDDEGGGGGAGPLPGDVYLLARIHLASNKPLNCLHVLEQFKLCSRVKDVDYCKFCLLAAQAYFAANRVEDVLRVTKPLFAAAASSLSTAGAAAPQDGVRGRRFSRMSEASLLMMSTGEEEEEEDIMMSAGTAARASSSQAKRAAGVGVEVAEQLLVKHGQANATVLALVCLERAKTYELLDNRAKCQYWLRQSMLLDCSVMESLERLVALRLSYPEEQAVLREVELSSSYQRAAPWLRAAYQSMLNLHAPATTTTSSSSAPPAPPPSSHNADELALLAEAKYLQRDAASALKLTQQVLDHDHDGGVAAILPPTTERCALVHVACLVELGKVSELFYFAHKQVADVPKAALSWYAVGAYYYSARKFDLSRRFFAKASQLDPGMLEAFVGSAHAHAMNEESDRAIAIYRAAARLFPNSHAPLLGTAMEYLRTNNAALAQQFCHVARNLCEVDPAVYNELGVISYRLGDFADACTWFAEAVRRVGALRQPASAVTFETITFNYAHALRRAGDLAQAITHFKRGLSQCPKFAAGHAALGLTYHMHGDAERAIECYHISLGLRPNDTLVGELMEYALVDLYG